MEPASALDLAHASTLIEAFSLDDHVPAQRTVMVFRSSVVDQACVERLRPVLDGLVGRAGRWTFDLEDRDRVLRIETDSASSAEVVRALREYGEHCAELD